MSIQPTKTAAVLMVRGRILLTAITFFCLCTASRAQDDQSGTTSDKTVAVNNALNDAYEAEVASNQVPQASPEQTAPSTSDQTPASSPQVSSSTAVTNALNEAEAGLTQNASGPSQQAGASSSTQTAVPSSASPAASLPAQTAPSSSDKTASSSPGDTFKISGNVRAAMGIDSGGNAIFTRANADLDERNWRILSSSGLNENINTYDPAIYSQLKVVMDASVAASVVSIHLNLTADPWSYTSKSSAMLVTGAGGDTARIQYLGWGATDYTINRILNTLQNGDSFALPEIKVKNGVVPATSITSTFTNIFNIPAAKMDYTFFPIREAWVDVKPTDEFKLHIFPMGYEDQAMTTDDPLKLSNNTEWWAESPWLDGWQQGNINSGATPVSFTKGMWDKSFSFFTKDSEGQRLTALRGVSVAYKNEGENETSLNAEIASPKTLWQDYGDVSSVPGSVRLKQFLGDKFYLGLTGNMHLGYTTDEDLDAENFVEAADTGIKPLPWLKINGEVASSKSLYDVNTPQYETKYDGNAYYAAIEASSVTDQDILRTDYYGMHGQDQTDNFFKSIVYFARMDDNFESSLSDYNYTRDDSYWADDLTFYPSLYRYLPGTKPGQSAADLEPFAIGNGIDYGRSVVSWRADENLLDGKLQGLEDIRHVTDNDTSKNLDNIYRVGVTYKATDKLTTKVLGIYDALPKTAGENIGTPPTFTPLDPFLIADTAAGQSLANSTLPLGKDPSLKTGSLGARYQLTDWAAINGVWDYTNDIYLNTDSFPNGDLNSSYLTTYNQNGRIYEQVVPLLYDQSYFAQPPYPYHNIFKAGLEIDPTEQWHIYTDYTRNPNKFSGNIDDNMNHFGLETSYVPTPKMGFFARYTLSNGYDINSLVNNSVLDFRYYNNFFFEMRMILPQDIRMSIQYGVGPAYNVQTSTTNPDLAYYSTGVLETQHIVRIVFDKKF